MILSEQIFSLLFCVFFGFGYCFVFYIFKKFLLYAKYHILFNVFFNLIMSILFFIGIIQINDGTLSLYYLLFVLIGFLLFRLSFVTFKCQI